MAEDRGGAGHVEAPIIKKVVKGGHGHHGGAWKVAYADMTTALMALFIVLWILAQSDQVRQNVAGFFRDPVGFSEGGVPSIMTGGEHAGEPAVIEESAPPNTGMESDEMVMERWRIRAASIMRALEKLPAFAKYRDQVELAVTPDGLRISLVESIATPLFQVGSLELNADAAELLAAMGSEMRDVENFIAIEGHTDSRPYGQASGMTNWELSSGRAHTARKVLEVAGVEGERIFEVRGYADRQLYNPLDPNDSRNRRVAITLLSEQAFRERLRGAEATPIDLKQDAAIPR